LFLLNKVHKKEKGKESANIGNNDRLFGFKSYPLRKVVVLTKNKIPLTAKRIPEIMRRLFVLRVIRPTSLAT
jgi:hypothetical protein